MRKGCRGLGMSTLYLPACRDGRPWEEQAFDPFRIKALCRDERLADLTGSTRPECKEGVVGSADGVTVAIEDVEFQLIRVILHVEAMPRTWKESIGAHVFALQVDILILCLHKRLIYWSCCVQSPADGSAWTRRRYGSRIRGAAVDSGARADVMREDGADVAREGGDGRDRCTLQICV